MKEGLFGLLLVGARATLCSLAMVCAFPVVSLGVGEKPGDWPDWKDAINRARQFQVPAVKGVMLAAAQASPQQDERLGKLLTRLEEVHRRQQESDQDKVQVCKDIQYHIAHKVISEEILPLQVQMDKLFSGLSAGDKARIRELIRTIKGGRSVALNARYEAQIEMFALLSRLVGQGKREWDSRRRFESVSRPGDDGMVISVQHHRDPHNPHKPVVRISRTRELGSRSSFGKDLLHNLIEVRSLDNSDYFSSQDDTGYVREQRICVTEAGLSICRYGLMTYVNKAMPQACRDILHGWGELDPGRLRWILETRMSRKIATHWDSAWDFRKWYQVGDPF